MKSTGVVRRIDELGRIVIPKEIRKNLRIKDGENLEIFIEDDRIILKKYSVVSNLGDFVREFTESIYGITKHNVIITDMDVVIGAAGNMRKEIADKRIEVDIENYIKKREVIFERISKKVKIVEQVEKNIVFVCAPILVNGDTVGLVMIFDEQEIMEYEKKVVEVVAQFLGKYLEN